MPTRHHLGTICFASALAPNSWMPGPSLLLALQLKLGSRRHTRSAGATAEARRRDQSGAEAQRSGDREQAGPALPRRSFHLGADGGQSAVHRDGAAADVDPFVLHLFAALAQKERAMISQRTNKACRRPRPAAIRDEPPGGGRLRGDDAGGDGGARRSAGWQPEEAANRRPAETSTLPLPCTAAQLKVGPLRQTPLRGR